MVDFKKVRRTIKKDAPETPMQERYRLSMAGELREGRDYEIVEENGERFVNNCGARFATKEECQICGGGKCPNEEIEIQPANTSKEKVMVLGTKAVGSKLTVTWGPEKFSPISYHTFDVGPFTMETTIKEDETADQAFQRAHQYLSQQARKAFQSRMREYFERVKETAEYMESIRVKTD
jgi:hypothetical protein